MYISNDSSIGERNSRTDQMRVFSRYDSFFESLGPFNTPETTQQNKGKVLRVIYAAFLVLAVLVAVTCGSFAIGRAKQLQENYNDLLEKTDLMERLLVTLKDRVENMEGWSEIN